MSNATSRARFSLFLVPLLLAPGCAAFRAQVGLGFGVGADVQVLGLQHVGVLLGKYHEWGPNYGRGTYSKTGYTVLGPYHSTHMTFDEDEVTGTTRSPIEHGCYGFFPGPTGLLSDEPPAERWALEFGVAMTFVELRFGFNPLAPIFNVEERPAGPQPAPTRAPRPTQPAAPEGPTASSGAPTTQLDQRTYGGDAREPARAPRAAPPPPPPPPSKHAPPASEGPPSAAESASQDVTLPEAPGEGDEEEERQEQQEAPPAPAPSDER